jgi:Domain of unknown function (DUF4198)
MLLFARAWTARSAAVIVLAPWALSAPAHDTWFAIRAAHLPGTLVMALGTGNQFPLHEFPVQAEHLREHGCRQAGAALALAAIGTTSTSLLLRANAAGATPVTCWSELKPVEIELAPDTVGIYLDEIQASALIRERWAAMQSQGLRWRERYVKCARVELAAGPDGPVPGRSAALAPMKLDVLLLSGLQRLRADEPLVIQVLREGAPLPDFPIELRGTAPGSARWFKTDTQGRISTRAPAPGRWVWRGTDLRQSATDPGVWDSTFITLAFEVHAPAGAPAVK